MKSSYGFLLSIFTAAAMSPAVFAQSRTVFKCTQGDKTFYSDAPCLGAQKIDVQPTRGLNKLTGKETTGRDVTREKHRELFVDALKPVTGMSAEQLDLSGRRSKLPPSAQQECTKLDRLLPEAERAEQNAAKNSPQMKLAQAYLYRLRMGYHSHRCE